MTARNTRQTGGNWIGTSEIAFGLKENGVGYNYRRGTGYNVPKGNSKTVEVCHPPGGGGENTDFQGRESRYRLQTGISGSIPPRNTTGGRRGALPAENGRKRIRALRCVGCTGSNLTYRVSAGTCARAHPPLPLVGLDPVHPTHLKKVKRYCLLNKGSGALFGGGVFPPHPEHWTPRVTHLSELTETKYIMDCNLSVVGGQ